MLQIIKQLEIIKSSILIEDVEIIELQIMKLNSQRFDEDVKNIISKLENSEYFLAFNLIENYISKHTGLDLYQDKELISLKFELKHLEIKFQDLMEEKTEYLNEIEDFNKEYNLHLAELIKSILNLRKELIYNRFINKEKQKSKYKKDIKTYNETKKSIDEVMNSIDDLEYVLRAIDKDFVNYDEIKKAYDELQKEINHLKNEFEKQSENIEYKKAFVEDDDIEKEYEDSKTTFDEFENEYEKIIEKQKDVIELNESDKKELKQLFRKAAKLCHPDIVSEGNKEQAHKIMQELNEGYNKHDLTKIKSILNSLENGYGFEIASDSIDDKEILRSKITEFEQNIEDLKSEIEAIKQDDTYKTISKLENWDEYFEELKTSLENEKNRLEKEIDSSSFFDDEIDEWIKELWKWADKNNISNDLLSRKKDNLLAKITIDFTNIGLKNIPKELFQLKNVTTLILWDNDIIYLPEEIVNFVNLKKLNLRGNPRLTISKIQKEWLDKLISKGCIVYKDNIRMMGEKSSNSDDSVFTKNNNFNTTYIKENQNNNKKYDDYWESEF